MNRSFTLRIIFFIFLFSFVLRPSISFGQWQNVHFGQGGNGKCIEKVGNQIWLGTYFGMFVSNDEGESWVEMPLFKSHNISNIYHQNDTLMVTYAKNFDERADLFCISSYNNGLIWNQEVKINDAELFTLNTIKIQNINSNLYLFNGNSEFFISSDGGSSWEEIKFAHNGISYFSVTSNNKEGIFMEGYTQASIKEYYFYKDEDQSYNKIQEPENTFSIFVHEQSFYTVTIDQNYIFRLLRSNATISSWDTVFTGQTPGQLPRSIREIENKLFFYDYSIAIVSEDNGLTWNELSPVPAYLDKNFVQTSDDKYLTPHYNLAVVKFDSNNNQIAQNNGIFHRELSDIYVNGSDIYINEIEGISKSTDNGITWANILPEFQHIVATFMRGDTLLFLNSWNSQITLIYSFNNGVDYFNKAVSIGQNYIQLPSLVMLNDTLFLNTDTGVAMSINMGDNWSFLPILPQIEDNEKWCIGNHENSGLLSVIDKTLYSTSESGFVFKYKRSENIWEYVTCHWSPGVQRNNRIKKIEDYYVILISDELEVSSDGINFHEPANAGLPTPQFLSAEIFDIISVNNIWFASIGGLGIYYSYDKAEHWYPVDPEPVFRSYNNLNFSNNSIYAIGYYSGLWKRQATIRLASGQVFLDLNNDGIKNDPDFGLMNTTLKSLKYEYYATTDVSGRYSIPVYLEGDTIKIASLKTYMHSSPEYHIANGGEDTLDFAVTIDPGAHDLSIDITNNTVINPGFNSNIIAKVTNHASPANDVIVKIILDDRLNFLNASPSNYQLINDTLFWLIPFLDFDDNFFISINASADQSLLIGDIIHLTAIVEPILVDAYPADNIDDSDVIVVGSYDPNDKSCNHGERISPDALLSGEDFEYTIRFQNTGTFKASNVHIQDILDKKLDPATLNIISYSHPMSWRLSKENQLDFYFDNIDLPDSNQNEQLSHGFVKYAIKARPDFKLKDQIENTAFIYFDFNEAIVTNTVVTTIDYPASSHPSPRVSGRIIVYPNPTNNGISLKMDNNYNDRINVKIMDINGKLIRSEQANNPQSYIQLDGLIPGLYMGIVTKKNGETLGNFKFIFK